MLKKSINYTLSKKELSKKLDQFYTQPFIAKECLENLFNLLKEDYSHKNRTEIINSYNFIEPSAGTGNFLHKSYFKKNDYLAFDIEPKSKQIIKNDFLSDSTFEYINALPNKKNIVFGNPPFGSRSLLAIDFFNRASLFSDIIAFIVPVSFNKYSVQSKLSSDFSLIYIHNLSDSNFIFNDSLTNVRCVFQIWVKKNTYPGKRINLRINTPPITSHPDFDLFLHNGTKQTLKYFKKNDFNWDFAVVRQGYADYKNVIYDEKKLDPKKHYMFFKFKNQKSKRILSSIDYEYLSKKNTTIPGFGKADIIKEYIEKEKK